MLTSTKILQGINGVARIPGDKSISHRSVIISSITNGITKIKNILKSEDVLRTINAFKLMGVKIEEREGRSADETERAKDSAQGEGGVWQDDGAGGIAWLDVWGHDRDPGGQGR